MPRTRAAVTIAAVNVQTTATQVAPRLMGRGSVLIFNNGPNDIFLGPDDTVTTATGFPVPAGTALELDDTFGAIFAIAVTANQASPANTRVLAS